MTLANLFFLPTTNDIKTDLFGEMLEVLCGLDVAPLDVRPPEGVEHLHHHPRHLLQELLLYLLCNLNTERKQVNTQHIG